ncbi:hypothetical protein AOQ84DRAFT_8090 [Glonium stellatum]|uniref:Uncharacterized protein n=1 Tax=Glonium stellatum TaxID=574774 RepID=A0A8E2JUF3_9PEZI|nr:hypothetical protein AOQ84DRAFT_8090 [Glonium stellatum]
MKVGGTCQRRIEGWVALLVWGAECRMSRLVGALRTPLCGMRCYLDMHTADYFLISCTHFSAEPLVNLRFFWTCCHNCQFSRFGPHFYAGWIPRYSSRFSSINSNYTRSFNSTVIVATEYLRNPYV